METKNINTAPESGAQESKQNPKTKNSARRAAEMAGAAGLGVAGTMAASAMADAEPLNDEVSEVINVGISVADGKEDAAEAAEQAVHVNPNDIKIEEPEVIAMDVEEGDIADVLGEPMPIGEDDLLAGENLAMVDVDNDVSLGDVADIDIDSHVNDMEIEDSVDDIYLADSGDDMGEPDVLGDILDA